MMLFRFSVRLGIVLLFTFLACFDLFQDEDRKAPTIVQDEVCNTRWHLPVDWHCSDRNRCSKS